MGWTGMLQVIGMCRRIVEGVREIKCSTSTGLCRATARDGLVKDGPGGNAWHCLKRQVGKQSARGW